MRKKKQNNFKIEDILDVQTINYLGKCAGSELDKWLDLIERQLSSSISALSDCLKANKLQELPAMIRIVEDMCKTLGAKRLAVLCKRIQAEIGSDKIELALETISSMKREVMLLKRSISKLRQSRSKSDS